MSSSFLDPRDPGPKSQPRPPIWAQGVRSAPPDLRQFARASLHRTRAWGAPFVHGGATRLALLSDSVAEGRWRVDAARLGGAARLVPSAERVGDALHGVARLVAAAAGTFAPPPPLEGLAIRPWEGAPGAVRIAKRTEPPANVPAPPAPEAAPDKGSRGTLRSATPRPRPPAATPLPASAPEGEADTLDVIRSLIRSEARPARPRRDPANTAPHEPPPRTTAPRTPRGARALPPLQPAEASPPGLLFRAASQALGTVILLLLLPVGTTLAAWSAWRGTEDLPEA
ncbi:MAG: hypothetical protein ACK4GO_07025 [Gemmobacter sp.]